MKDDYPDVKNAVKDLSLKHLDSNVTCFDEVSSTMKKGWEIARDLPKDESVRGRVVVADHQTSGKGRQGRDWFSPKGMGIYVSILLQPPLPDHDLFPRLTVIGALGVVEMIEDQVDETPRIRWPNDVVFPDTDEVSGVRKVAGILVETRQLGDRSPSRAVIGVGINVNTPADEFPENIRDESISLQMVAGRNLNRTELFRTFLKRFDENLSDLYSGENAKIDNKWTEYSAVLNRRVRVRVEGEFLTGTVEDVSLEQGLTLRLDEGGYRVLEPSHVELLRLMKQ